MLVPIELRRSGVTLIEVLVAIFVASIGLLALLALFPVGALSMKQALKDSRCTQTAINAFALFKSQKLGLDPTIATFLGTADPFVDGFPVGSQYGFRNPAAPNGPSYPVYIDPLGANIKSLNTLGTSKHLPVLPDVNTFPPILRTGVGLVSPATFTNYQRWFSLLDDINFDSAYPGQPCAPVPGSQLTRDPRYTFAYMVRRPYAGNPTTFDVTIVVYSGRSINTVMGSLEEQAFNQVQFTQGSTMVNMPFTGGQPNIKPGGWILDASLDASGIPQGYFYRVADVINNGNSTLTLELQSPARQTTTTSQGLLLFLDNVAEVFEKGTISLQ